MQKKQNGFLRRTYKLLRKREAKGKGEKERYTHLNVEFQRKARRDNKAFLGDQSEKAMATHSSTLAGKIPRTEEPGRLRSMGSLRVGHNSATSLSLFTFMHWRRKWQPIPVFLPRESQGLVGWESGGLLSLGSHRVRHD